MLTNKKPRGKHLKNLMKLLFFAGLVFLPLIYWPKAEIPYEIPKVVFVQYWVRILMLVGLISLFRSANKKKINAKIITVILFYVLIASVSSFLGVDPMKSFLEIITGMTG